MLSAAQLPSGYTRPAVTTFSDHKYLRQHKLSVLKATVHNADPAITMANIISNGTIGVTKQVSDIIAADFLTAATGNAYADIVGLENNFQSMLAGTPALTDAAPSYIVTVNIYVKTT